jgi:hypothetical protein
MSPESSEENTTTTNDHPAVEHVAEAHRILSGLRQQLDKHPDLDEAIAKLEMALNVLTTKTGGML